MQINQPKRKFDDYTTNTFPSPQEMTHNPHAMGPAGHHAMLAQHLPLHLRPLSPQASFIQHSYGNDNLGGPPQDHLQPPQPLVIGKEKKPRKKREKKPKKEEETKPKVLFRGIRFELWLEGKFEEELLELFSLANLEFSINLGSGGPSSKSWEMIRSDKERVYKEKWRKRYRVYSADLGELVGDSFNFHIRLKGNTGEYNKLPFIAPDQVISSPLSSYSNYLSLLGGAHINPSDDHCGYPPGEQVGEDACTLYEGSDVSFVLVGQPLEPNPSSGLQVNIPHYSRGHYHHHGPDIHAAYHHHGHPGMQHSHFRSDGNHP